MPHFFHKIIPGKYRQGTQPAAVKQVIVVLVGEWSESFNNSWTSFVRVHNTKDNDQTAAMSSIGSDNIDCGSSNLPSLQFTNGQTQFCFINGINKSDNQETILTTDNLLATLHERNPSAHIVRMLVVDQENAVITDKNSTDYGYIDDLRHFKRLCSETAKPSSQDTISHHLWLWFWAFKLSQDVTTTDGSKGTNSGDLGQAGDHLLNRFSVIANEHKQEAVSFFSSPINENEKVAESAEFELALRQLSTSVADCLEKRP